MDLVYRVLWTTVGVIAAAFVYLLWKTPSFSGEVGTPPDTTAVRMLAEQRSAVFSNFVGILEKLITTVFLPLLTAILGYLFGTRQTGGAGANQ